MDREWKQLYDAAKSKLNPRQISPLIEAGGVASAVLTDRGSIYTGVCIDTACGLGMCAERNAVANMITNGESRIVRLACVMGDGTPGLPCGACRELLMQLCEQNAAMEILTDCAGTTVTLRELLPAWWGQRFFTAE